MGSGGSSLAIATRSCKPESLLLSVPLDVRASWSEGLLFRGGGKRICRLLCLVCLVLLGLVLPLHAAEAMIKPIEQLVPVSFTHCCASTPGLSTWWSSTALKRDLVLRGASRLDAFSGYPVRT